MAAAKMLSGAVRACWPPIAAREATPFSFHKKMWLENDPDPAKLLLQRLIIKEA